jgi:hypothetical protein
VTDHPVATRLEGTPPCSRAAALAFFSTALLQALIVKHFGVNVPFWDDWGTLPLLDHFNKGTLTGADLFAQHTDHRLVVPRLIFLAIYRLTGEWTLTGEMMASAVLSGANSALLAAMLTRAGRSTAAVFFAAVLLASPLQWENILWGFQVQFYLLIFLTLAVVAIITLPKTVSWAAIAAICGFSLLCTFTMGSGMSIWGVAVLCLAFRQCMTNGSLRGALGQRRFWTATAALCVCGALSAVLYLRGYHQTFEQLKPRDLATFLWWTVRAFTYPLLEYRTWWLTLLAVGEWSLIGISIFLLVRRSLAARDYRLVVPVVGILAFLVVNVFVTGLRRSDYINSLGSPEILSRYTTIFLFNAVLLVIAVDLALSFLRENRTPLTMIGILAVGAVALSICLIHVKWVDASQERMDTAVSERIEGLRNVSAYIRNHEPSQEIKAPFLYPELQSGRFKSWLVNSDYVALLPRSMRSQASTFFGATSGTSWSVGGSHVSVTADTHPFAWGSWSGDNLNRGWFRSEPMSYASTLLAVPLSGYPRALGNEVAIETADGAGLRVVYDGKNPGERWETWFADISELRGHPVRIVAVDGSPLTWLGVDRPEPLHHRTALFESLTDHLEAEAGYLAAVILMVLFVMGARPASLSAPPRWTLVTLAGVTVAALAVVSSQSLLAIRAQRFEAPGPRPLGIDALTLLPGDFVSTTRIHRVPGGLFMHPDSSVALDVVTFPGPMCLVSDVVIDKQAPRDPESDGVDFSVFAQDALLGTATALPDQPAGLRVRLPANKPVALTLRTSKRRNDKYDWAIWMTPRFLECRN